MDRRTFTTRMGAALALPGAGALSLPGSLSQEGAFRPVTFPELALTLGSNFTVAAEGSELKMRAQDAGGDLYDSAMAALEGDFDGAARALRSFRGRSEPLMDPMAEIAGAKGLMGFESLLPQGLEVLSGGLSHLRETGDWIMGRVPYDQILCVARATRTFEPCIEGLKGPAMKCVFNNAPALLAGLPAYMVAVGNCLWELVTDDLTDTFGPCFQEFMREAGGCFGTT